MRIEGTLTELVDGVYAFIQPPGGWCVNNAGVLVGPDGLVLVDTVATRRRALALRTALEQLDRGPVRHIVNTHHHGDHHFGNCVFAPPATVIGHDEARRQIQAAGLGLQQLWPDVDWGEITLVPPDLTFPDRLDLYLGGHMAELHHAGPAHTTNDVVVWLPDARVLFTGDVVMSGVTPYVPMGSVHGSLRTLRRLRELNPRTVVSGHGPIAGPEVIDDNEEYLRWVLEIARAAVESGRTPLEAARWADLGRFEKLLDPERIVGNLHRAYLELIQPELPLGVDLAVLPAFQEMIEFNGGLLPRCDA